MSDRVIISKSKLDTLADTIKSKSGATDNLTLDELVQKVKDIQIGSDGNDVATIKLPYLTANSNNSYFELPQSIIDIRGIEIKYRFTDRPSGESWICGNWKNNSNTFLLGYYNSMLQFSVSSTAQIRIPFDTDWHIAKIENNRLFIDETQSENEITWSNLGALGNLNIFRSPHTGGCLYKDISYVKITDVSGKTQTYYPYIIENSVAFVSEENRVTSSGSFTYPFSNDYYESHKLFWALDTIGFGKSKPKAFAGNNRLYYFPRFMNSKCLEIIDWSGAFSECTNLTEANINTSNGTNFSSIFYNCSKLINVINTGDFSKGLDFTNAFRNTRVTDDVIQKFSFDSITNGFGMFGYGTKITQLPKFNHETITDMGEMFWASALSDLGETDLNFPNVTNADYVFGQTLITKAPNLSFPKATTAKGLFQNCSKLNNFLKNLDIPKVTTVYQLFKGCTSLIEIGSINAPLATASNDMFNGCTNLTTIGDLNLNVCTNINGAFYNCANLKTIGILFIPKVQTFNNPFYNCKVLESIEQFDVSSATSLASLFAQSNNLKSIDFVNSTSKVTNFSNLFNGKTVLETVKGLDLSSATNVSNMFLGCSNLKNVTFVENSIKISFSLGDSLLLTDESIQSLINGLATVETAQNLTIHSNIATKLTDEQKTTISSKNWNIVIPQGETRIRVTDANTLIATIGGRQFTKTNNGLAIACIVTFGRYTGILLVSEVAEAVTFSAYGYTLTSAGSFTYNNKNYYYSSRDYFMDIGTVTSNYPNLNSISGKTYTNDNNGSEEASTDLLNYYFNK